MKKSISKISTSNHKNEICEKFSIKQQKSRIIPHSYPLQKDLEKQQNDQEDEEDLDEIFSLLQSELDERNKTSSSFIPILNEHKNCLHKDISLTEGKPICKDCGIHISEKLSSEEEFRLFNEIDNKSSSDMTRCQFRKTPDKGIRKDLERFSLPSEVVNIADQLYFEVTQGDIKRSNLRKGIMFACVFEAYKESGKAQTPESLQQVFGLTRKNISKGLTYFYLRSNKKQREYITAQHFIPSILEKLNIKIEHAPKVLNIYKQIENKSAELNARNPQSVSCGLVYYYLKKINADIPVNQFGNAVGLSDITINSISNIIDEIIG